MSRVRDQNGNVIELAGEDLEKALRSGAVTAEDPVAVEAGGGRQAYDPSLEQAGIHGSDYSVVGPDESIAQRADDFYADKYGGVGGGAAALGAGVARGLTFGGSDVLLDQAGLGEDLAGLQEYNPGLSTVGELGGAVLPGVLSGGSGTLARLLAKTPGGALARASGRLSGSLKGSIGGGALEGAAYGAGQGVSSLAISNEPLTAEAVWSEVGMGAIYGASAGAAFGGVAHGLEATGKFLKGKAVARQERAAAEAVDNAALRSEEINKLGFTTGRVTKHLNETADDLVDTAARVAQGSDIAGSPKQLRSWAQTRHETLLDEFNQLHANAIASGVSQRTLGPIKDKIHQSLRMARTHVDPKGVRIDSNSFNAARKSLNNAERGVAELAKRLDKAAKTKPGTTYQAIAQRLDDLDDKFHAMTGSGGKAPRMSAYTKVPPTIVPRAPDPELAKVLTEAQEARKAFREVWGLKTNDVINETVWKRFDSFDPGRAKAATESWARYQDSLGALAGRLPNAEFKTALDLGRKEWDTALKEIAPPGANGHEASELMKSLGMFGASEVVPDIDGPVDDALRFYLKGKAAHGIFKAAGGRTPWSVNAASNAARRATYKAMPGGGGFFGSAAGGAASSMAAAGVRAVAMGGAQMAQATGKAIARIEMAMEKLASKAAKASRRSVPGVGAVLKAASFGDSEETKADNVSLFKRRSGELAQAMSDPMSTQQRIHDNLADIRAVHPMVADHMEIQGMKTLGFLYDKMPKDPGTIMSLGRSRWVPDDLAVAKWSNYVRAAADPTSVIEDAANGTLNPQGAEVLRVLYPATFTEVQKRLWERMPELQENSTYDQRVRLSILFAVPLESSMDPKMKRFVQQRFADENAEQQNPIDGSSLKPEKPTQAQTLIPMGQI